MILIADDDIAITRALKIILERNEYEVMTVDNPKSVIDVVRGHDSVDLVMMDMNYSRATDGEEGLTLLRQVKVFRPDVPVILMTAWGNIDLAVRGMRMGAFDFITKPWDNIVLMERVRLAFEMSQKMPQSSENNGEDNVLPPYIIGKSQALIDVLSTIKHVAPTNAPVLITGESGTGKELIAQALHDNSKRHGKPFVKVNLGGISSTLFESEMFGHVKGAFTDAKADRKGRFEMAEGGTIFLDEIGELDMASQVKLLRVLQDQTYEVLGDSQTRRADVRVVCATNANLQEMVRQHTFREDLFYRINLVHVKLPALRERTEDIPLLVKHFTDKPVMASAISHLKTLPYPGNIRELKNLVERTTIMSHNETLTTDDFIAASAQTNGATTANGTTKQNPVNGFSIPSGATLEEIERVTIEAVMAKHHGNLSLVAKELGISRGALYRKLEKHGLS